MTANSRTAVEAFLNAYTDDPDETVIEAIGTTRMLTVGHLRDLVARLKERNLTPEADQSAASYSIGTITKNGGKWLTVTHGTCDSRVYEFCLDDGHLMAQLSLLLEHACGIDVVAAELEPRPGHGPGAPGAMHLEAFGQSIADAFGSCPYHVGSSATSKVWRDVDVRLILPDDQFHALFPGFAAANHVDAWWSLLCAALSELGRKRTGLPIDFQIQSMTEANTKYPGGIRNPLMLIRAGDEHLPAMKETDRA